MLSGTVVSKCPRFTRSVSRRNFFCCRLRFSPQRIASIQKKKCLESHSFTSSVCDEFHRVFVPKLFVFLYFIVHDAFCRQNFVIPMTTRSISLYISLECCISERQLNETVLDCKSNSPYPCSIHLF